MTKILLLILLFFLAYTAYTAMVRLFSAKPDRLPKEKTPEGEDMVKDPVCGVFLPRCDAVEETIAGRRHYFCSTECRDRFRMNDPNH